MEYVRCKTVHEGCWCQPVSVIPSVIWWSWLRKNRRANPVEVLYASFPFFLYLNASYGGQLLSPLLEFQDSSQWTQPYAARDLGGFCAVPNYNFLSNVGTVGSTYPQATGNNTPHSQGVERMSLNFGWCWISLIRPQNLGICWSCAWLTQDRPTTGP